MHLQLDNIQWVGSSVKITLHNSVQYFNNGFANPIEFFLSTLELSIKLKFNYSLVWIDITFSLEKKSCWAKAQATIPQMLY